MSTTPIELAYAVEYPRPGFPGETWRASYGTLAEPVDDMPTLAADLAHRTRIFHSYRGSLTVSVWEVRPDEHYRMPVPDTADIFHFPATAEES
ncbi:hypothetical protein ACIQGZ_17405 [Streptomyces sp. NPDC092296]|uniref:hypothetical protein n=1 Tax=Streptomyces sp. NPDC092296 TaxID=3366012 RepID=UPI00380DF4F0